MGREGQQVSCLPRTRQTQAPIAPSRPAPGGTRPSQQPGRLRPKKLVAPRVPRVGQLSGLRKLQHGPGTGRIGRRRSQSTRAEVRHPARAPSQRGGPGARSAGGGAVAPQFWARARRGGFGSSPGSEGGACEWAARPIQEDARKDDQVTFTGFCEGRPFGRASGVLGSGRWCAEAPGRWKLSGLGRAAGGFATSRHAQRAPLTTTLGPGTSKAPNGSKLGQQEQVHHNCFLSG